MAACWHASSPCDGYTVNDRQALNVVQLALVIGAGSDR